MHYSTLAHPVARFSAEAIGTSRRRELPMLFNFYGLEGCRSCSGKLWADERTLLDAFWHGRKFLELFVSHGAPLPMRALALYRAPLFTPALVTRSGQHHIVGGRPYKLSLKSDGEVLEK